jgi:D-proline reductase (dithiol) PrdB
MSDRAFREAAAADAVPELEGSPFVSPPQLAAARVAIVTTAALHSAEQTPIQLGDHSFRLVVSDDELMLGHPSPNFDRTGWLSDPNVVFPIDRLRELEADGTIGSVAKHHLSFGHATIGAMLTTIGLDSGPAAAALLHKDDVDVVLLTPV